MLENLKPKTGQEGFWVTLLAKIDCSGSSAGARKIVLGPSFSFGPTLPLPSPPFFSLPSHSLEVTPPPEIQLGGMGERCKLHQRGLGRSRSRQTIWYILALKSDIWWQQFY